MNEFEIYDKIVNGELRPHLEFNSSEEGLAKLRKTFLEGLLRKVENEEGVSFKFEGLDLDFLGIQDGDIIELEIPEDEDEKKNITVRVLPNPEEQELINLEIWPPIDEKSETYLSIIEGEYRRIITSSKKQLESSDQIEKLKLYAHKNIQLARKIGKQAYLLEKKLNKSHLDKMDNPNTLILHYLKRHIVYLIRHFQDLFNPIINQEIQSEHEIEDELFEMEHSRMMARLSHLSAFFKENHRKRLYEELGDYTNIEEAINFFKKKLIIQNGKIDKSIKKNNGVVKNDLDTKQLLEEELGNLLSEKYLQIDFNKGGGNQLVIKCTFLIHLLRELNLDQSSAEFKALDTVNFFSKTETEIALLKHLIEVDSYTIEGSAILDDLISLLLILQGRKYIIQKEDEINDLLSDFLRIRKYYVADQSRQGRSGTDKTKNYGSGELDITIRDFNHNGIVKTIIEALELKSCGKDNKIIGHHINKLLNRYDTSGNKENYIVVYAKASDFSSLWNRYKNFVTNKVFDKATTVSEIEHERINKANLKLGLSKVKKAGSEIKLYHLFVNMYIS